MIRIRDQNVRTEDSAITDLSDRGNVAQVTPRRRDAHCKLALVQAPFSLSAYFHPSSTMCTHMLHIFRDPRFNYDSLAFATFTLLSFVFFSFFRRIWSALLFSFYTWKGVCTCARLFLSWSPGERTRTDFKNLTHCQRATWMIMVSRMPWRQFLNRY